MSILTKEEREEILHRYQAESIADAAVIRALLDTIVALEAERDAFEGIAKQMEVEWASECQRLAAIRAYALEHSTTKVIGGAHAALREILAVIDGGEPNDSIRRVTCKCINGGETTINWRTGCGETLCHAELIDEEGEQNEEKI